MVGWAAIAASATAVVSWAGCCVLPLALSVVGLNFGLVSLIAGQRGMLTFAALAAVGLGWALVWRRARACGAMRTRPPSRATIAVLSAATLLVVAALAWQPIIEPWLLALLRVARG